MPLLFYVALQRAARQVGRYLEGYGLPAGLGPADAHVLSYLDVYGPCTVTRLIEVLGLHASTLTSLLRRLERAGLLLRRRHPRDRRAWLLELTDKGRIAADRVHSALDQLDAEVAAATSEEEVEGFEMVVKTMDRAARAAVRRQEDEHGQR
jgi:DNA-binding MarR family transcriptional regulator